MSYRLRAIGLYKELHRLGRDYPNPSYVIELFALTRQDLDEPVGRYDFHGKLRKLFQRSSTMKDPEDIEKFFKLAEHIRAETLSLYSLAKYRHLKRQGH